MKAITVESLSKSYADVEAIREVTFEVNEGEIFGLIGPDGAGKTTLIRILATLLLPDKGKTKIGGLDGVKDYKAIRLKLGYMPGRFSLYQDLSVEENLQFFASVFGTTIQANYELIAPIYTQIEPFKDRRAGALSGGMKQKLALCCALIHKPEVLLLDEPGTGVDPVSRQEFWEMLATLRAYGITILVSTPNMDEAERCDRVALMQKGRVMAIDSPEGIINAYKNPLYAVRSNDMYRLIQDLRTLDGVADCYAYGEYAHVKLFPKENEESLHPVNYDSEGFIADFLASKQHREIEIKLAQATIEDCFIDLMKR